MAIGRRRQMEKIKLEKLILVLFLLVTVSFGDTVLERKILSDGGGVNSSNIMWIKMFLTQQSNKPFILVLTGGNTPYRLYTPNSAIEVKKEYGVYEGGYVKNDQLIMAFWNVGEKLVFYDVQEGFKPMLSVKMQRHDFAGIIADSQEDDKFYLLDWRNTGSWLGRILSGGHGICLAKPFLMEIKNDKILRDYEVDYKGKRNESYHVEDMVSGAKLIHFLGLRDDPGIETSYKKTKPVMLYYAGYDVD
jgi:hypothetical protein